MPQEAADSRLSGSGLDPAQEIMRSNRALLAGLSAAVTLLLVCGGVAVALGAADGAYRQVRLFSEVLSLVLDNYVEEVDADVLLRGAYRGLLGGLGARGGYLTREQVEAWREAPPDGADPGIVVLKAFGSLQVVSVLPGSPADVAGIEPGDQIRRLDGEPVRDLSLDQAVRKLRGAPGSTVRLGLLRPLEGYRREEIVVERARRAGPAYRIDVEKGVGVLALVDPLRVDSAGVARELEQLRSGGVRKLLLDLRNVAEASPRDIAPLAELFTSGSLFRRTDRSGRTVEAMDGRRERPAWTGEVAVLVNAGTADGAEGLAQLLRERLRAPVYGEGTYGLGSEAKLLELPDGGGLLVPAYAWVTAAGTAWDGEGLKPDHIVRAEGKPAEAKAEQLRKVIEALAAPEAKAA